MASESNQVSQVSAGALVIPCTAEEFGEFISSLLGNPQIISKLFRGVFEVSKNTVEDLYHLVDQRVSQQNEAKLLSFNVTVSYDDNSSVELTSLAEFISYNEVKPRISTGVSLNWCYLIKFQGRNIPEKQEISLSFATNFGRPVYASESEFGPGAFFSSGAGAVYFRIKHTARTWGGDIESLLNSQIENIIKNESAIKKAATKYSSHIGTIGTLSIITSSLLGSIFATSKFKQSLVDASRDAVSKFKTEDLNAKIDYIIELTTRGDWHQFIYSITLFVLISIVIAIAIGITLSHFADNRQPSFVLLTKKADENRRDSLRKHQNKWVLFLLNVIGAITISVFSNWLFVMLFQ